MTSRSKELAALDSFAAVLLDDIGHVPRSRDAACALGGDRPHVHLTGPIPDRPAVLPARPLLGTYICAHHARLLILTTCPAFPLAYKLIAV